MIIDDFTISGILSKHVLSMEYDLQQYFEHEILVEMSASRTEKQKESLEELLKYARTYLSADGNQISLEVEFVSVPKGMEDYADMIKSNSMAIMELRLKDMVSDALQFDDVQEAIREQVKTWAISKLKETMGGVS